MYAVLGDITTSNLGAIVDAANETLRGGGGVDGAIHRAAGPELVQESTRLAPCPVGEVRVTRAYRLKSKYVIHTVGPVWHGGTRNEDALLATCYSNALNAAAALGLTSIAFPAISCGVYGFPFERASRIAVATTRSFLEKSGSVQRVDFYCYSEAEYLAMQQIILLVESA